MRRTSADRKAKASRAQQMTEQRVQDRKTGEWYNPQERFMERMNSPELIAVLKRMKVR